MPLNLPINDFINKRVWIIGASSGIGEATAHCLLKLGSKVALSARKTEELHKIESQYPEE
jgi:NADP-dependent 3-hydroxy acid dehydrogenase YdfG